MKRTRSITFYFEEPLSAYNYHIKSMSDNLLEIYNFNSSEYYDKYSRTVSIAASRLQYLLEIPEVKDYFENIIMQLSLFQATILLILELLSAYIKGLSVKWQEWLF